MQSARIPRTDRTSSSELSQLTLPRMSLMTHVTSRSRGSGGRHVRRNATVDQTDRRSNRNLLARGCAWWRVPAVKRRDLLSQDPPYLFDRVWLGLSRVARADDLLRADPS